MPTDGAWTSLPLQDDVRLVVEGTMPDLPADVDAAVSAVWAAERARHPALFNGRVFCADRITSGLIAGHWTEYRRVLAQMRRPDLAASLRIRSLAVNGLLECVDGLVLGRRQAHAVYLAGCWQAAPAGAVEARDSQDLDLGRQLLAELREELGLMADEITRMHPVAAIGHGASGVVDVGFLLRTALRFADIEARHAACGNGEYDRLRLVASGELDGLLRTAGPTLLPSARMLMEAWRG